MGWHLPLFLVQGWLTVPIWAYGLLVVCLSVLMTWAVNLSRGSVIPAILMHAIFNSSFPILVALCQGVPTREPGLTWYLAGVVLSTVITVAATRGRLGYAAVTGVRPTQ
jgi:membrane protease YdiL (CAAX protease family)